MANDLEFKGDFDERKILESLKRVDRQLADVEKRGTARFAALARNAGSSLGIVAAAGAGVLGGLALEKTLALAGQLVEMLREIPAQAAEVSREFEGYEASIRAGLRTGPKVAGDVFREIREQAKELGVDLKTAVSLFSEADSLDDFTQKLKEQAATLGDNAREMNTARIAFDELLDSLGGPGLDSFTAAFERLNGFLQSNETDLQLVAGAIGDLAAEAVNLVSSGVFDFLEGGTDSLAPLLQTILDIGETLSNIVAFGEAVSGANQQVSGFGSTIETGALPQIFNLNTALESSVRLIGLISASFSYLNQLDPLTVGQRLGSGESIQEILGDAEGAFAAELERTNEILADNAARIDRLTTATEDREAALESSTDASVDYADALKREQAAADDAAKAQEEAAKAAEKISSAKEKFTIDQGRARLDLELKQQRALLDAEIDFAQKREDIARKNAERVEDIYRKSAQDRADASTDLTRDEQDIARKGAERQADLERESARQRIRVEEDYQREIKRIRDSFLFDAEEAIRANDSIAFLRIQRRAEFEKDQAREARDQSLEDARSTNQQRREDLQQQLQREVEEARLANQRKLEDLRINLARQLEEQQINYQWEIEAQQLAEQRKREELARSFQQQQDDFNRQWQQRLADLQRNLQKELEILRQFENQRRALSRSGRSSRNRRDPDAPRTDPVSGQPRAGKDGDVPRRDLVDSNLGPSRRRRFGGRVQAGLGYLVGERGAEEFIPDVAGQIIPNHQLFSPVGQTAVSQTIDNSRNIQAPISLNDPSQLSPQQVAIVQQIVHEALLRALN